MLEKFLQISERELRAMTDRVMATVYDYPLTLGTLLMVGAVGGYLWASWMWN